MSKVVLVIREISKNQTAIVRSLRKAFGLSIADIMRGVGSESPLLDQALFDRSDPTFAKRLLTVLGEFDSEDVSYAAYELLDGQDYWRTDESKLYALNADRLREIIDARESSLRRQRD